MRKTGYTRRPWTNREMDYLRTNAGKLSPIAMSAELGRTVAAIRMCASDNSISLATNRLWNVWSQREIDMVVTIIRMGFKACHLEGLFSKHTMLAVESRFLTEKRKLKIKGEIKMKRNPERFEKMASSLSAHNTYYVQCGLLEQRPDKLWVDHLNRKIELAKQ